MGSSVEISDMEMSRFSLWFLFCVSTCMSLTCIEQCQESCGGQDGCPPGFVGFQGNCYHYAGEITRAWEEAEVYCQSKEAHLASIHSTRENNFVSDLVRERSVWLGGLKHPPGCAHCPFKWTDDTQMGFTFWATGQPDYHGGDERCIELNFASYVYGPKLWNDSTCFIRKRFVCKKSMN